MALTFYYGSGSPYAWKVQLALEYKGIDYERKVLSFSAGDTKKPEFAAINPRMKVPTIDDDGFVLYESNAIVEYLDESRKSGAPLFPGDARQRALVRRMICEVDNYVNPAIDKILDEAFKKPEEINAAKVEEGRKAVVEELALFSKGIRGDFLAGPLSAADFALYPYIAFLFRVEHKRLPELGAEKLLTPALRAWRPRIEALPFFAKTWPPHWT